MQQILLATDIDGTLVGDDDALSSLNKLLSELREKGSIKLAYVTGRSLMSYRKLKTEKDLLTPDALITAVGTEIYQNEINLFDNWPTASGWDRDSVVKILDNISGLTKQPKSEQRPFKVSFYVKDNPKVVDLVRHKLSDMYVDVLYSHQLYLDILPRDINKGSALSYLSSLWDIDNNNIIACGDSANDIDMLNVSKAIIVANTKQELLEWVTTREDSQNIYLAKQAYASGIVEGLKYFKVL